MKKTKNKKPKNTKRKSKSSTSQSSFENKYKKIKIIFPIVAPLLIILSGALTLGFTFKNHIYYDYLSNKYEIEKNNDE
ncbi:MAG: hypothetical protein K2H11_00905, partial [Malacoplasma sp.]|nr:hypothetical protein [Malacoplasma sp.]